MIVIVQAQCPIVGVLQICCVCCLNYDAEKEGECVGEKRKCFISGESSFCYRLKMSSIRMSPVHSGD